jgi:hypothetical protein
LLSDFLSLVRDLECRLLSLDLLVVLKESIWDLGLCHSNRDDLDAWSPLDGAIGECSSQVLVEGVELVNVDLLEGVA